MNTPDHPKAATETTAETVENTPQQQDLPDAAKRALAEAEERRIAMLEAEKNLPVEKGGRGGLDPARYGDWERKGLTVDF